MNEDNWSLIKLKVANVKVYLSKDGKSRVTEVVEQHSGALIYDVRGDLLKEWEDGEVDGT